MNAERREQVRSNALYLRRVRPLDPEEIAGYVEDEPHPAAVQQVLRELALPLALVEDPDGTFRPAPQGEVRPDFDGVDAVPERYLRVLEDRLVAEFGAGWPEGEAGDRLRERIRQVKDRYLRGAPVDYDALTALGYAIYHLPAYYAAIQYVLDGLAADGRLSRPLRVLDVGAGVGGPALGLFDFLPDDALVEYHAVEPSAAADVLSAMLDETGPNVHSRIHRTTAEDFDPAGVASLGNEVGEDGRGDDLTDAAGDSDAFDLVLFANVLSELDDPEAVLRRYLDHLAPDGSLVALSPADRNTATHLREVERAVADDGPATVYAPTVRLWPGDAPESECWSFDVRPDLDAPPVQQRLDEGASGPERDPGEFVNSDVKFAYSVLRTDGERAVDVRPDRGRHARLAESETFVTERVDLLALKLSRDLSEEGHPLFLVGDGSERIDHFAVLTRESALNDDLRTADYGDCLAFENALVLWNDDEGAYNVVVDGETVVDRVPT